MKFAAACIALLGLAASGEADCSVNTDCGSCLSASCSWCSAKKMCRSAQSFNFCAGLPCVSASISGCDTSCSSPAPPPAPTPAPAPAATCPDDETTCYSTPGCGYCIDGTYDGECRAGDLAAPFTPPSGGCTKQWTPGVYRAAGSMCVMASGDYDVRCYQDCTYGSGIETFVVPSQAACDAYDSAYGSLQATPDTRKAVHEHIAAYLLQKGVEKAHARLQAARGAGSNATDAYSYADADAPNDMTRQYIADGLNDLESDGLSTLETGCCDYFTGDALGFCNWGFTKDIESYVNDKIESIPLVRNVNNWLVNTANELVPGGVRNVVDDVADVYNAGKSVVDACEDAGKAIVHGLFGWL